MGCLSEIRFHWDLLIIEGLWAQNSNPCGPQRWFLCALLWSIDSQSLWASIRFLGSLKLIEHRVPVPRALPSVSGWLWVTEDGLQVSVGLIVCYWLWIFQWVHTCNSCGPHQLFLDESRWLNTDLKSLQASLRVPRWFCFNELSVPVHMGLRDGSCITLCHWVQTSSPHGSH